MREEIRQAREIVQYAMDKTGKDPTNLARLAGVVPSTLTRLMGDNPTSAPTYKTIMAVMAAAGIMDVLRSNMQEASKRVPLYGDVGAGQRITRVDGDTPLEFVDAPLWAEAGTCALIVKGDSMFPAYWEGDIIYFDKGNMIPFEDALYRECVVALDTDELYLKQVTPGIAPGTATLVSYNASPIRDVVARWVSPVTFVDRRFRK
ncbi:S24 family peptidase [Komagataeibacter xylinus]|uniref:Peptidase S24/S26A/S26B/S26C domain-containing protein n=1 Tax=Komagataeibacter xylinus TaxID=28448 RepID=A0A857FIZ9_KOMXY|nr:S24 family peptidase [Komagataeibacter xylinus]QHC34132.1 hypothetical protein FMA36_00135 [Komagataeibacter xylinus]